MTIKLRKSTERGFFDHGFLKTYHTFSFGEYYDPNYTSYHHLRVLNEDLVIPDEGFHPHPHKDMEIITIVMEGELSHKDSTGSAKTIKPNQVQFMSAGSGITHSEFNASKTEPVHFFQIWIIPDTKGLTPSYSEITLNPDDRKNKFQLIVSPEGPLKIHQDAKIFLLDLDKEITYPLKRGKGSWVHLINGSVSVNGIHLGRGDAVSVENDEINIKASEPSRIILFDLA